MSLEATDEFLKNRVMNLPESVVAGTHNTEEGKTCRVKALPVFLQSNCCFLPLGRAPGMR